MTPQIRSIQIHWQIRGTSQTPTWESLWFQAEIWACAWTNLRNLCDMGHLWIFVYFWTLFIPFAQPFGAVLSFSPWTIVNLRCFFSSCRSTRVSLRSNSGWHYDLLGSGVGPGLLYLFYFVSSCFHLFLSSSNVLISQFGSSWNSWSRSLKEMHESSWITNHRSRIMMMYPEMARLSGYESFHMV